MKEKIKQFYLDHEEAILFTSVALVSTVVGGLFMRRRFNKAIVKAIEGGVIENVEPLIRGDGVSVILAHARNGQTFYFAKDQ